MRNVFAKFREPILLLASLLFLLILSGCAKNAPLAELTENGDHGKVALYMFWGDGCPHCAEAKPVLQKLDAKYPDLNVRSYEVWYVKDNQKLYLAMADKYGVPEEGRGVPLFFLGNQYWIGWTGKIGDEIESKIQACLKDACQDAGAGIMPGASEAAAPNEELQVITPGTREISFLGLTINLENQSLFVSTLLISFVDGINPCSVWVLSMLMALTLHTGSRKKVVIIGIIFLTVTAAIYAMFIAGLFTFLSIVNFAPWIQAVVALVALFFGLVNIKDYFWYKEGISMTIADDKKPGIFKRIRNVMDASENFWSMAGATVVLAAGVSLVEFSCTAGFPVLWTNLLTSQGVTAGVFALLLLVYMIIYQLDEMAIFFTAVFTLKASRVEEKHGRILKLIGGMLMFALAFVMLVQPSYMNTLSGSLVVFLCAAGGVVLVLLLHRRVLPAMGIWIGTEKAGKQKASKKRLSRRSAR